MKIYLWTKCACAHVTSLDVMEGHLVLLLAFTAATVLLVPVEGGSGLQIGVKHRPTECTARTKAGDRLSMHYTVRIPSVYVASLYMTWPFDSYIIRSVFRVR